MENMGSTSPPACRLQQDKSFALGDGAIKDPGFYSSIHQEYLEHKHGSEGKDQIKPSSFDAMDFSSTHWDLIGQVHMMTMKTQILIKSPQT